MKLANMGPDRDWPAMSFIKQALISRSHSRCSIFKLCVNCFIFAPAAVSLLSTIQEFVRCYLNVSRYCTLSALIWQKFVSSNSILFLCFLTLFYCAPAKQLLPSSSLQSVCRAVLGILMEGRQS
ncbi:hypothetical protein BOX15_Mlig030892g1 [Macrostomum lignano]|uniref:Uncharacterized protein n=1 Tax=Macrostomum lignano TaxID=282301 RepID=A0A267HBG1_9PLAT|nr:hypothetical protein BOX15_Mlig030892g1 [Macrostomum lignano]